ncbi:MAG: HPP family protein [Gammaproteobacteria bacterium]|nr:HPP family protein [Gammaproteobacteria bacterium]
MRSLIKHYLHKMQGTQRSPHRVTMSEVIWSWVGGFSGVLAMGLICHLSRLSEISGLFLIGSFGASAVLLYGAPGVPYAQPRNLVGGHIISATVGVTIYQLLPEPIYLTAALTVATAIAAMHLTKTLHPPGGATALIAVIGGSNVHDLGFLYILTPVTIGTLIMLLVALLVNNIPQQRHYPVFWI